MTEDAKVAKAADLGKKIAGTFSKAMSMVMAPSINRDDLDEVDVKYSIGGQHYDTYTAAKNLIKSSQIQLDGAVVGMDKGILKRIKDSEQEYYQQVKKFLAEKENELKTVLRQLEEKNLNTDGKDRIIRHLRELIMKIESDGLELTQQLKRIQHRLVV